MGADTSIQWTTHTSNCWHGCEKVDALCKHCYAEVETPVRVQRARGLELWGGDAARREVKSWRLNLRAWNRAAAASGRVVRVFSQSMSDTFEDYSGGRVLRADGRMEANLVDLRREYLTEIGNCVALTFQLLTKRPENVLPMVPPWWREKWPTNVWIGTSVGTQASADERIPHLLRVPAAVRFLSVEPQLEAIDLSAIGWNDPARRAIDLVRGEYVPAPTSGDKPARIHWLIQGGESHRERSKARPFDLEWAWHTKEQCDAAGIAHFFKQAGSNPVTGGVPVDMSDSHGGDPSEWPAWLRDCRAFPDVRP